MKVPANCVTLYLFSVPKYFTMPSSKVLVFGDSHIVSNEKALFHEGNVYTHVTSRFKFYGIQGLRVAHWEHFEESLVDYETAINECMWWQ